MTNEPKSLVERHVKMKRMEFPIAIVKTPEEAAFGVRGFPTSLLLDVDGTILWKGHPGAFERKFGRERLEKALAKAAVLPPLPDKHERAVAKHVDGGYFGRAYDAAVRSLERSPDTPELQVFVKAIEDMAKAHAEQATQAEEKGEFARALALYETLADDFDGVPTDVDARAGRDRIEANRDAKDDLTASEKWDKAMQKWRKGDFRKSLKDLESISKKYGHTPTGVRAAAMLQRHEN